MKWIVDEEPDLIRLSMYHPVYHHTMMICHERENVRRISKCGFQVHKEVHITRAGHIWFDVCLIHIACIHLHHCFIIEVDSSSVKHDFTIYCPLVSYMLMCSRERLQVRNQLGKVMFFNFVSGIAWKVYTDSLIPQHFLEPAGLLPML